MSCEGIHWGYFHSARWSRLLWCCPLALLLCWHLSAGCGGVRDERRHRSTSEWLISSELCCPTSEYACTHPHTHTLCCVSNRKIKIRVFSVCVLVCFRWKILLHVWCLLISIRLLVYMVTLLKKLVIGCWKLNTFTRLQCFFPWRLCPLRLREHQDAFMWLNEEMWYAHSVILRSHLLWRYLLCKMVSF